MYGSISPEATFAWFLVAGACAVACVAFNGPDRWRAPLTWLALAFVAWLVPHAYNAYQAI